MFSSTSDMEGFLKQDTWSINLTMWKLSICIHQKTAYNEWKLRSWGCLPSILFGKISISRQSQANKNVERCQGYSHVTTYADLISIHDPVPSIKVIERINLAWLLFLACSAERQSTFELLELEICSVASLTVAKMHSLFIELEFTTQNHLCECVSVCVHACVFEKLKGHQNELLPWSLNVIHAHYRKNF